MAGRRDSPIISEENPPPRTLVYYYDYACPLSYLGKKLVDRYERWAIFPVTVEHRCVDLYGYIRSPSGSLDWSLDTSESNPHKKAIESAKILKETEGLSIPLHTPQPVDSFLPHQVAYFVRREMPTFRFRAFHDAMFDAYWKDKRDISDPDTIVSIADDCGISTSEVRIAMYNNGLTDEVRDVLRKRQRIRHPVSPTLVYQKLNARGVTSVEEIRQLVQAGEGHPADEMGARWFHSQQI